MKINLVSRTLLFECFLLVKVSEQMFSPDKLCRKHFSSPLVDKTENKDEKKWEKNEKKTKKKIEKKRKKKFPAETPNIPLTR